MLEEQLHKKIKELAVKRGTTINNLVREFAEKECDYKPAFSQMPQPKQKQTKKINNWWRI